jgi:hypothetical protein
MGSHINEAGEFQSDKCPTCPPGKVPLSVKDPMAQDLLWQYAERRKDVDAEFAGDLKAALFKAGYRPDVLPIGAPPAIHADGPQMCSICGTLMELRMWDRPGGLPGNGYGCPKCHPWTR